MAVRLLLPLKKASKRVPALVCQAAHPTGHGGLWSTSDEQWGSTPVATPKIRHGCSSMSNRVSMHTLVQPDLPRTVGGCRRYIAILYFTTRPGNPTPQVCWIYKPQTHYAARKDICVCSVCCTVPCVAAVHCSQLNTDHMRKACSQVPCCSRVRRIAVLRGIRSPQPRQASRSWQYHHQAI